MIHLSIARFWTQFVRLLAIALCATLLCLTATPFPSLSQAQQPDVPAEQLDGEATQDHSPEQKEESRSPNRPNTQSEECELSRQAIQSRNRSILFCIETGILNESGEQRVARIQQQIDKILQGVINVETLEIVALEELERSLGVSQFQDLASQSNEAGAVAIVSRARSLTGINQVILVITELDASLHLTQSDQSHPPEDAFNSITPHDLAEQYVNRIVEVSRQEYASQKCFPVIFNSSPYASVNLDGLNDLPLASCSSIISNNTNTNEVTLFYVSTAGNFWNAPFRANVISNRIDEFANALSSPQLLVNFISSPFAKSLDNLGIGIRFDHTVHNGDVTRIDSDSSLLDVFESNLESTNVSSICSENFETIHDLTDIQSYIKNYICGDVESPTITLQYFSEASEHLTSNPSTDILMTLSLDDARLYELDEIDQNDELSQNNEPNQNDNEKRSEVANSDQSRAREDIIVQNFDTLHRLIEVARHHQAQINQVIQEYRHQYILVLCFMLIPVIFAVLIWILIIIISSVNSKKSESLVAFFKEHRDRILFVYSIIFSLYFNLVLLLFVLSKNIWLIVIPIIVLFISITYLFLHKNSSKNLNLSNSSLIISLIAILSGISYLFYFFPFIRRSFVGEAAQTIFNLLSSYFENELPILVGISLIAFLLYLAIPPALAWVASQLLGYTSHESRAAKVSRSRAIAKVARLVIIILTFIMASPHLPGAGTAYFAGVSGFVALAFSVSASTSVGDLIAGLIIVFFSKIEEGDRVNICNGVSGTIIEQNLFVHRIRTGSNEIVTIRNAKILSDAAIDYTESESDPDNPLEISIPVTLSYDYDWRDIDRLLKKAAIAAAVEIKAESFKQQINEVIAEMSSTMANADPDDEQLQTTLRKTTIAIANQLDLGDVLSEQELRIVTDQMINDLQSRLDQNELLKKALSTLTKTLKPTVSHVDLNPSFVVYELSICPQGMNIPDLRSQIIQEIRDKCAIADIDLISPQYQANWPLLKSVSPSDTPASPNNADQ